MVLNTTQTMKNLLSTTLFVMLAVAASAQQTPFPYSNKFTLGGGVSQLLLGGFNVQAEYTTRRMVFDYSHGFNINLNGTAASVTAQDQKLSEKLTSTLGIGVGYRITPTFDVRFEPKLHLYELHYDGMPKTPANRIGSFKTVTLGVGAYYRYYPFRKQENALAGVLIMPSVRYWPNVWSSLTDNKLTYSNRITERNETYKAPSQGFPGTGGLLANVTIAYTFGMGKK